MVANLENMALLKKFVIFLTMGVLLYCRDPLAVLKALASTVKPVCTVINIFKEIHEYVTLCPSCNACVFFVVSLIIITMVSNNYLICVFCRHLIYQILSLLKTCSCYQGPKLSRFV